MFASYSWNLDDTPSGKDDEINPDVLGYIFEKYINQKAFGAYYTRTEITEYLCEQTIHRLVLEQINTPGIPGLDRSRNFESVPDLLVGLDANLCSHLLFDVLPKLSLLDPACGSGAFLVAAMKTLINLYSGVIGKIEFLGDKHLSDWLRNTRTEHPSLPYFIKRSIITDNLFGVDIMDEATEIARLRLFLALVASVQTVNQLEPLPNIDFNILPGNSLIGLLRVDEKEFDRRNPPKMFQKSYHELVEDKRRQLETYRHTTKFTEDLRSLRDEIEEERHDAYRSLNDLLLNDFSRLGIKYEQSSWDINKNAEGKPFKRAVRLGDVEALHPFHWGYEFDEVMNTRGGFDAIITNPPWEIFKPNAKEFFKQFSKLVTKKKMSVKDFEKEQDRLLEDPDIREAWLKYQDTYPHVSSYFRSADQYINQISVLNGKKAGSDINLYKLFTEQCFNLLRQGGYCGIVLPNGIYNDLGTKQLREMLFEQTQITGLFCFDNRKEIFEGVHRSYKFVVLSFVKGRKTVDFPTAFMRADVEELGHFPQEGAIYISVNFVRQISPDSLSILEFKNQLDVNIVGKMLKFPFLGDQILGKWSLKLTREFDMTNDNHLFETEPSGGRLPLYEGKMIWQFDHRYSEPRYWVEEKLGRRSVLGKAENDVGQVLDYQQYRLGFRSAGENTNERNFISTIIPRNVFCGNSIILSSGQTDKSVLVYLCATFNSFLLDYAIRLKISRNMNMFYVYQLPIPRLIENDAAFKPIVERASKLICTVPEFDDLAKDAGLKSYKDGVTDPTERGKLRAELDGMIAHLYGLTEEEFAHILTTFPIAPEATKQAAMEAFKLLAPKPAAVQLAAEIAKGESQRLEFKASARWDYKQNTINTALAQPILKTCDAFFNTDGGKLLIGVDDCGKIIGLKNDYQGFDKKKDSYENWLTTLLLEEFGRDIALLVQLCFYELDGNDVCQVTCKPSPQPVYSKTGSLYIRANNSSRQLSAKETVDYCKHHWT